MSEVPGTIPIPRFYTCEDHVAARFARVGRQLGYSPMGAAETVAWQRKLRAKVSEALGIGEMEPCEPLVDITERTQMDGYTRERIELQTEPEVWTTFYALIPDGLQAGEKRPLVLAPHGHDSGGKFATAGRIDIPIMKDTIVDHNYDYGVAFARQGWITFCPDARGFGERRESTGQGERNFRGGSCYQLNSIAMSMGMSLAGMWTWDLMRLIDYGATRAEVDANRVGCAGLSGGGLQVLYLSAVDERVKVAVTSGYFYGVVESLLYQINCACNYVPGMWKLADMGDLGALIAPRPFMVETGDVDGLNGKSGLANVISQVEITRAAYKALGAEDKVAHSIFHGPHLWNGTESVPWLKKWL